MSKNRQIKITILIYHSLVKARKENIQQEHKKYKIRKYLQKDKNVKEICQFINIIQLEMQAHRIEHSTRVLLMTHRATQ